MKYSLAVFLLAVILSGCSGRQLVITDYAAFFRDDPLAVNGELRYLSFAELDTLGRELSMVIDAMPEPIELVHPDFPDQQTFCLTGPVWKQR